MDIHTVVPEMKTVSAIDSLGQWIEDEGLLVMLHEEAALSVDGSPDQEAQFVSCFALVDSDVETVREAVRDYENYENILDEITSSTPHPSSNGKTRVDLTLTMDTPIFSPNFNYSLEYQTADNGDLLYRDVSGDFDNILGRWEFLEAGDRTLLIHTVWNDYSNLGFTFRTMFWAQPDLKIAMPMTQAAVMTEQIRLSLSSETNSPPESLDSLPDEPATPALTRSGLPKEALLELAE
ncbi:MAG: hypothetical protein ABEK50_13745, partial [bacterium]